MVNQYLVKYKNKIVYRRTTMIAKPTVANGVRYSQVCELDGKILPIPDNMDYEEYCELPTWEQMISDINIWLDYIPPTGGVSKREELNALPNTYQLYYDKWLNEVNN